ncbi:ATP-binding protein [Cellulomonas sp. HD19AZ1]|uniref:ATP-binding protein n=1 Tax=Cellulomonas sp. HD19AZ1 TaxID=2559593 RepID=UPI001070AF3B|nr:ATP-binding protein [Cellulomonas sp. HD19AZ1]TFH71230.1 ATP-binding protein [Cellulomonas sp. HD19AZ1]
MIREIDLPVDHSALSVLEDWFTALFADAGWSSPGRVRTRIELATHEVCVNVVDHSGLTRCDRLHVRGAVDDRGVTVHVSDGGAAPDRTRMAVEPVPGVPQEGGYGLMIVRKLVDDFEHTREGAVNTWRLHVHRPPAGGAR